MNSLKTFCIGCWLFFACACTSPGQQNSPVTKIAPHTDTTAPATAPPAHEKAEGLLKPWERLAALRTLRVVYVNDSAGIPLLKAPSLESDTTDTLLLGQKLHVIQENVPPLPDDSSHQAIKWIRVKSAQVASNLVSSHFHYSGYVQAQTVVDSAEADFSRLPVLQWWLLEQRIGVNKKDSLLIEPIDSATYHESLATKPAGPSIRHPKGQGIKDSYSLLLFTPTLSYRFPSIRYLSSYHYDGYIPFLGMHKIGHSFEGASETILVDSATGALYHMAADMLPLPSPDTSRMLMIGAEFQSPDSHLTFYTLTQVNGRKVISAATAESLYGWDVYAPSWTHNNSVVLRISPKDIAPDEYSYDNAYQETGDYEEEYYEEEGEVPVEEIDGPAAPEYNTLGRFIDTVRYVRVRILLKAQLP